jgi:hypothetical protein
MVVITVDVTAAPVEVIVVVEGGAVTVVPG